MPLFDTYKKELGLKLPSDELVFLATYQKIIRPGIEKAERAFIDNLLQIAQLLEKESNWDKSKIHARKMRLAAESIQDVNFHSRGWMARNRLLYFSTIRMISKRESVFKEEYVQLRQQVDPNFWIDYPIEKIYKFHKGQTEEINPSGYEEYNPVDIFNFRGLVDEMAMEILEDGRTRRYVYFIIPEFEPMQDMMVRLISGGRFGGRAGGGMTKEYIFDRNKLIQLGTYNDWMS